MNGEPVKGFEPGRIYAIEFFSTTCGHCKEAAPVVAELHNVFSEDVTFFAVTDEDPEKVKAWLAAPENAEKVHFPIAADPAREGNRALQYGTFKVSTPRIFIVKDGIVQWYGHPNGAQETIDALMDGTWDPERVKADFVIESCMERARDHMNEMRKEIEQTGDWSKLYRLLDSMAQALPERKSYFELQKFGTLIGPDDKADEGYALGRAIVKAYAEDIASLRTVARTILNSPWVQRRDLAFAHEVALAADRLGQGKDSRAAEILALSWFSQGDREKALAEIDRALALEPDPKVKAKYEAQKVRFTNDPPVPLASTPLKKGDEHVDAGHSAAPAVEVAPMPGSQESAGATQAATPAAPEPR